MKEQRLKTYFFRFYFAAMFFFWACVNQGCAPGPCPETGGEFHHAVTDDGWRIALHRHPAPGTSRLPVIVCHGLGANHQSFEADEERNLGKYLSENGYDVWLLDLRGVGSSDRLSWDYTFDDYVRHDLPAAIEYVKKITGARAVHWIGHSMGGMVMYAYLASGGTGIRSAVAIGSPASFEQRNDLLSYMFSRKEGLKLISHVPGRSFARFGSRFVRLFRSGPWSMLVWNADNMDLGTMRNLARCGADDMSAKVLKQFSGWISGKFFVSSDGKTDYLAGMSRVTVPILFVAGSLDNLAAPLSVKAAWEAVPAPGKEFRIFARANGDSADYGHTDLVAGKRVREEVFPVLLHWVEAH